MIDLQKLFAKARAAGIEVFEARVSSNGTQSVSVFNDEVENRTVSNDRAIKVRGIVDGKCGVFTSDRVDDGIIETAIAALEESAAYGNPVDPDFFVGGDAYVYEKVRSYYECLTEILAERLTELAKDISARARKLDKRVKSVSVTVEYRNSELRLANSKGLDAERKSNMILIVADVVATDVEVQSGMHYEFITDIDKFDADEFSRTLVEKTVLQFGGGSISSGKYKAVLAPEVAAAFIAALSDAFSAFAVEQHVSLLEGKAGKRIFSPLFTLGQVPIGDSPMCSSFDDEGVPRSNGLLIDKGVLTGYVYDLATAKRAGVRSTGNGALVGGNIRPAVDCLTVQDGDKSPDELFAAVGDGVYITSVNGVHSGLNARSGDYSLQASGYMIENGKRGKPISLMTIASNILDDFANVTAAGNDGTLTFYGIKTPSLAVDGIRASGHRG